MEPDDDDAAQYASVTKSVATPMATKPQGADPASSPAVPISSLTPLQPVPRASSLHAVVALIYPYSSATDTLALLLTEPDFRLRLKRGQVRVQFRGPAARAVASARVGIGDEVTLGLKGGKWVESSGVGTPGRGVEGELVFRNFVQADIVRDGVRFAAVNLDQPVEVGEEVGIGVAIEDGVIVAPTPVSGRIGQAADSNAEHASPAFLRGKRVGSGGFSVAAVDPFVTEAKGYDPSPGKRRRIWRYVEKSESPEGDAPPHHEKSSPVVIVEEDEEVQSQNMAPTTPTPAPVGSRRDARLVPLVTTDLLEQTQLAPPLSTPRFKIPSTPPAPPTLRPIQSPALPMVSPFNSMPPAEGISSSLPAGQTGSRSSQTAGIGGNEPALRQVESQDYFGIDERAQHPEESMQMSNFVDFEHDRTAPPASYDAELGSTHASVDLTKELIPQQSGSVGEKIATTETLLAVDEQFFDFTAAGQTRDPKRVDEFVDPSRVQDVKDPPDVRPNEEQRVQGNERYDESMMTQDTRETRMLAHETSLPSPTREPGASKDETISPIASQDQLEPTTQDTVPTQVPIPMLPTPATSQNRLLEMITGLPSRQDAGTREQARKEQREEILEHKQDLSQQPPTTPAPETRTSKGGVRDVPEVLSPWFSSRRGSRNKPAIEQDTTIATTPKKDGVTGTALAVQSPHELEQQLNKFASGLRTRLSYFTPLASLQPHLNTLSRHAKEVDILALVSSNSSAPERAKGGPRDFYTSIHLADQTRMSAPVQVQILRPRKISLPTAAKGDVMLLRNFAVKSLKRELVLVSGEASGWCVWRLEGSSSSAAESSPSDPEDQDRAFSPDTEAVASVEECRGPPVEVDDEERTHVLALRHWWSTHKTSVPDVVEEQRRRRQEEAAEPQ